MGRLITYLMEPETDDNLITWGWTDHLLEVTPESVDAVMADMLANFGGGAELTEQQRTQLRERAEEIMNRRQQVPMMRVMEHQRLPVMRVASFNDYQRNRFFLPHE